MKLWGDNQGNDTDEAVEENWGDNIDQVVGDNKGDDTDAGVREN